MIDEKYLKYIEQHSGSPTRDMISFSHIKVKEFIRLARLGLWARDHRGSIVGSLMYCANLNPFYKDALAALPKEDV